MLSTVAKMVTSVGSIHHKIKLHFIKIYAKSLYDINHNHREIFYENIILIPYRC